MAVVTLPKKVTLTHYCRHLKKNVGYSFTSMMTLLEDHYFQVPQIKMSLVSFKSSATSASGSDVYDSLDLQK